MKLFFQDASNVEANAIEKRARELGLSVEVGLIKAQVKGTSDPGFERTLCIEGSARILELFQLEPPKNIPDYCPECGYPLVGYKRGFL